MSAASPYRVLAYNTAKHSENKIHDDAVARRFGFGGGLVPGVEVYAYMAHLPVERWGRAWLERGTAACRFLKPVYDGETASVTAAPACEMLALRVESRGELCATGEAGLPAMRALADGADGIAPPPPRADERPQASESSLAPGTELAIAPFRMTRELLTDYLAEVRETDPLYLREGLAHPGLILRTANSVLVENVVLGPWIHVGSRIAHFAAIRLGDEVTARARVSRNYEHKGHRFVDLDLLVLTGGTTPVARIAHTAIYEPR
jgi:acyl dehydratase